tara:strand:+ start:3456 stop:3602 length:147 start_codon:yes stop_codon:yes gene_type:complete
MRLFYFIILFLFSCSDLEFPWKDITFSDAKVMASDNNKIIMLDFYAQW